MEPKTTVGGWDLLVLVFKKGIELLGIFGSKFLEQLIYEIPIYSHFLISPYHNLNTHSIIIVCK